MNEWFDYILGHARELPEKPAIVTEDRVVTYGMLVAALEACARRLVAQNLARDGLVGLCIANPIRHMTLSLALFRIGIRAISLEPVHKGLSCLALTTVVGDEAARGFAAPHFIPVTDEWFMPAGAPQVALPEPFAGGRTVCRFSLTSGTTGEAKLLPTPVEYIGRNLLPRTAIYGCGRVLPMLGLSSAWSFTVACGALASAKTVYFAQTPYQAIRIIDLFGIDYVVAGTEQVVSLVRAARKTGATVSSLRTVAMGGAHPTRALVEAAALYLCNDLRSRYGSSELGLISEIAARDALARPGYMGHPVPGIEVAAFGRDGQRCAAGEAGIVMSRVKREPGNPPDSWTDHGDFGWIAADGAIFVVGRTADIADLDHPPALEVSPIYEVEHLLRLEWDAADAAAIEAGGSEAEPEIWVGAVACTDADATALQRLLRSRGVNAKVRLFQLAAIPRGANGKVRRGALKEALRALA